MQSAKEVTFFSMSFLQSCTTSLLQGAPRCHLAASPSGEPQNAHYQCDKKKGEQASNCTETHCQEEFHSSGDLLRRDHRESLHNHVIC